MKSFKNQNWLFLLVILSLQTAEIFTMDFSDEVAQRRFSPDSSDHDTEITDLAKEREEKEIQERIERIKQEDIWKDNRTAKARKRFSINVERSVRNSPTLSDSEISDQAHQATTKSFQDELNDWETVEKPTSPSPEKNTSVKNVKDLYEKVEAARKEVVKNFKNWLNDLVNPKHVSIEEAKENLTNRRSKNLLTKEDVEKITTRELKQRALREVKEFEAQVGSLSLGSGDSTAVFNKRLQVTQDIYKENAQLLQNQFDTYNIPKIVVAARPKYDLDPENYTFNIIDLGQKELGSDQTLQQRLDTIVKQRNIAENNNSDNIKAFDKEILRVA